MKISFSLVFACMLCLAWQSDAQKPPLDFGRYKMRLPPPQMPGRLTPAQQYMRKKLEQAHPSRLQMQNRPRPIPMHLGQNFISPPVGPPVPKPHFRPTPIPHRNPYKNGKIVFHSSTEKPFQSSQPIGSTHEFDYHVQTNNIPTNSIPIKQVGEKGPIHTIPAPNLSLADKPQMVEEVHQEIKFKSHRPNQQHQQASFLQQTFVQPPSYANAQAQHQNFAQQQPQQQAFSQQQVYVQPQQNFAQSQQTFQYIQADPQYQVTESNDQFLKNAEKLKNQIYFQKQEQKYEKLQNAQFGKQNEPYENVQNQFEQSDISSDQLYELLKPHLGKQQTELYFPQKSGGNSPVSFSEFQDGSSGEEVIFKPNKSYLTQVQHQVQNPSYNNQANQVFNYERHAPTNAQQSENESGFITANYNFKAADQTELRSPYIQEVFEHQINGATNGNVIELNRKPNQIEENSYFTTLPNQQVADTLASLQASGKLNIDDKSPLQIFVSDEQFLNKENAQLVGDNNQSVESEQDANNFDIKKIRDQSQGQNEESKTEQTTINTTKRSRGRGSYGSRSKPKQN